MVVEYTHIELHQWSTRKVRLLLPCLLLFVFICLPDDFSAVGLLVHFSSVSQIMPATSLAMFPVLLDLGRMCKSVSKMIVLLNALAVCFHFCSCVSHTIALLMSWLDHFPFVFCFLYICRPHGVSSWLNDFTVGLLACLFRLTVIKPVASPCDATTSSLKELKGFPWAPWMQFGSNPQKSSEIITATSIRINLDLQSISVEVYWGELGHKGQPMG